MKEPSHSSRRHRTEVLSMAMGDRPAVETASAPIAALDVALGLQYMASALGRLPFRSPFSGPSSPWSNLGGSVTREVIRSCGRDVAEEGRQPSSRAH